MVEAAAPLFDSRFALSCHEYIHKTYAPDRFNLFNKATESPMATALKEIGIAHEKSVMLKLEELRSDLVVIDLDMPLEVQEHETARALQNPKVNVVAQGSFGRFSPGFFAVESNGKRRTSRPDLLVRISHEPAPFGIWAPVDIKSHSAYKDSKLNEVFTTELSVGELEFNNPIQGRFELDDALQLSHYHRHLDSLGLAGLDSWAGIIGRDGQTISWMRLSQATFGTGKTAPSALNKYDEQFATATVIAELAIARNENPSVPAPARPKYDGGAKMCKNCEFLPICLSEMVAFKNSGEVTLLATVTPNRATKELANDCSIGELSAQATFGSDFEELAARRARVYLSGIPELVDSGEKFEVPTFDIEIDIDLENSQGALQELQVDEANEPDRLYLYGYVKHDRNQNSDWTTAETGTFSDYTNSKLGEHSVYLKTWNYLQGEISSAIMSGKTIGIFHYSHHEKTWWRNWVSNFSDLIGTPTGSEMEFFIENYLVDLRPIAEKIIFPPSKKSPVCDYSIKTLAPLAGFAWRADDAGGANSLLKYKEAIGQDEALAAQAQDWLRNYNIDDVKATMALRNWLRTLEF